MVNIPPSLLEKQVRLRDPDCTLRASRIEPVPPEEPCVFGTVSPSHPSERPVSLVLCSVMRISPHWTAEGLWATHSYIPTCPQGHSSLRSKNQPKGNQGFPRVQMLCYIHFQVLFYYNVVVGTKETQLFEVFIVSWLSTSRHQNLPVHTSTAV